MTMPPLFRKVALTAHVTSSVGWLGAVAAFLALAVSGLAGRDPPKVRAAYLAMEMIAWFVIVPLSLAAPVTGFVMSIGTPWGVLRHYWVLVKILLTLPATAVLLLHMQPINHMARVAADEAWAGTDHRAGRVQLVASAGAALVVLLAATALSVLKPKGQTRYGRKRASDASSL